MKITYSNMADAAKRFQTADEVRRFLRCRQGEAEMIAACMIEIERKCRSAALEQRRRQSERPLDGKEG